MPPETDEPMEIPEQQINQRIREAPNNFGGGAVNPATGQFVPAPPAMQRLVGVNIIKCNGGYAVRILWDNSDRHDRGEYLGDMVNHQRDLLVRVSLSEVYEELKRIFGVKE